MQRGNLRRTNTILYCRQWSATVVFYRDVLNLAVLHETDWFVEFRLSNESRLSVADARRTSIEPGRGRGITLSFQVWNLDAVRSELLADAIATSDVRLVWGSRAFYIHDPEGNRIEFWA